MRMYDHGLIGMNYTSVQKIARIINWREIARAHGVKKKFKTVVRKLFNKQFLTDHGKSGNVASLTRDGVLYVQYMLKGR
ncbi:MAG: hypothetical protein ACE5J9_07775 [Methanosarcinales archaeon]